ncbi:MAG TPA: YciI family protein [Microvirga sp.]|jgi:hypothetical protein|nr:YciI family protein [Microvirga sp.]
MQFLVIAYDKNDDQALHRRKAVREQHLEAARRSIEAGTMLIGGAILNDAGEMVGSMTVVSFPERTALDAWLQDVPYMRHGIWDRVEVRPYHTAVLAGSTS